MYSPVSAGVAYKYKRGQKNTFSSENDGELQVLLCRPAPVLEPLLLCECLTFYKREALQNRQTLVLDSVAAFQERPRPRHV